MDLQFGKMMWIDPVEHLDDLYNNEVSDFFGTQVKSLQITKDGFIVNNSIKIPHSKEIYTYMLNVLEYETLKNL